MREGFPNFNQMPEVPKEIAQEAMDVVAVFNQLKGEEAIETIKIPENNETAEEYIRKLEIMKKGTIVPIGPNEQEYVIQRIDQYIEKLKQVA